MNDCPICIGGDHGGTACPHSTLGPHGDKRGASQFCIFCLRAHGDHLEDDLRAAQALNAEAAKMMRRLVDAKWDDLEACLECHYDRCISHAEDCAFVALISSLEAKP